MFHEPPVMQTLIYCEQIYRFELVGWPLFNPTSTYRVSSSSELRNVEKCLLDFRPWNRILWKIVWRSCDLTFSNKIYTQTCMFYLEYCLQNKTIFEYMELVLLATVSRGGCATQTSFYWLFSNRSSLRLQLWNSEVCLDRLLLRNCSKKCMFH